MVAIVICLAGFSANNVLAQQTVTYTDPSGVTATYDSNDGNSFAILSGITNIPTSVTKWVIPEYVTFDNGSTFPVTELRCYEGVLDLSVNGTVTEIVFPRQMYLFDTDMLGSDIYNGGKFTNLHKVIFGEMTQYPNCSFWEQPLDTVVFLGSNVIRPDENSYVFEGYGLFTGCPSTTKIIVPCGKLDIFVLSFNNNSDKWQQIPWQHPVRSWTTANFYEAECLNTLTVLSNDVNLGNVISQSGCTTLTTTTPNNTTTTFSGTATLYALAKVDKLFTGWSDGNTDNPRIVTVASDTTFTANFATCEGAGIQGVRAASPLKVYPNPTNNTLQVEMEREVNNGTLTLFDLNGKAALSQPINGRSAQMNMSMLNTGNYILRLVENGTASAGVQVIKQ